jgi:hypothetical protein
MSLLSFCLLLVYLVRPAAGGFLKLGKKTKRKHALSVLDLGSVLA